MTNEWTTLTEEAPPRGEATQSLAQSILRELLHNGARPGDRLPTEHDLARRFSVSRPTVRQALKSLDAAGLVESRPRRGTVIKHPDLRSLGPWFGAHVALAVAASEQEAGGSKELLISLGEARLILECGLAPLAAARRDSEDLAALRASEAQMQVALAKADRADKLAADAAFHRAFARAAHNPVLSGMAELIDGYFEICRKVRPEMESAREDVRAIERETLVEHRQIREALETRDGERARDLMARHLRRIVTQFKNK